MTIKDTADTFQKPRPVRNRKREPKTKPEKESHHPLHTPYSRPKQRDWIEELEEDGDGN